MNSKKNSRIVGRYKSKSRKGVTYQVRYNKVTQELSCNCPGWTFKRGTQRKCRHVKQVVTRQLDKIMN